MDHPLLHRWHEASAALLPPGIRPWDAHTHTGDTDPDGFSNTQERLIAALDGVGHAGAVVCTSADPLGYRLHNDRIASEAAASDGRLIPFLRVDPTSFDGIDEVRRILDKIPALLKRL